MLCIDWKNFCSYYVLQRHSGISQLNKNVNLSWYIVWNVACLRINFRTNLCHTILDCRRAVAIQERVTAVLRSVPKEAYADNFQKLYERCQPCVVQDGDYFEGQ
jgi:hypothetical protein